MKYQKSVTLAAPASEPLTLGEAKNQCEIAEGDTSRDVELSERIEGARTVVENDTATLMIQRTVTEKFWDWAFDTDDHFYVWQCYYKPVSSITSITYQDSANASQTVSSSDYSLDAANNRIVFVSTWTAPVLYDRWDAITVTYVCGYGTTPYSVPAPLKQLMRLRVAYEFESRNMMRNENIGDNEKAYENLLRRYLRSTYP